MASLKVEDGQLVGDLASTFETESQELLARFEAKDGDLILLVMAKKRRAQEALGHLRIEVAKALDLIDPSQLHFLWVVDWPLLEWNEEQNRYQAMHHLSHREFLKRDRSQINSEATLTTSS